MTGKHCLIHALGLVLAMSWLQSESQVFGQSTEVVTFNVNYSGLGGFQDWGCGGCIQPNQARFTERLSFYPIMSEAECASQHKVSTSLLPSPERKECQCINEALGLYGRIWVGLQNHEMTPTEAKVQLTAHLDCESYCGRWDDCERLLRFIDGELAKQRLASQESQDE